MNPRFYNSDAAAEHYLGIRWPRFIWGLVLAQAIDDIVDGPSDAEMKGMSAEQAEQFRKDIRAAAEHWIADDENDPRRFVWVCEVLDCAPSAVRRSIIARSRK